MDDSNQKKTPEICILGAGFAGLTVAIQLRRILNWDTFEIYEQNEDIGGAWFANTYPGAECEYPSHFYCWSFEPNPDWSHNYSAQPQILAYMKKVAGKYNLYPTLKLKTRVDSVTWHGAKNKWYLVATNLETGVRHERDYDFVVSGLNFLWQPNRPKEFDSFKGPCIHTAEWDHNVTLENKIVGVIGSGSSAVQLVPAIASKVKKLHSFQRQGVWVLPKIVQPYSALVKWIFKYLPFILIFIRWWMFWKCEIMYKSTLFGSEGGKRITDSTLKLIKEKTKEKPSLYKNLVPTFPFGCKVVSFSSTYFPALASSKVEVHRSKIVKINSNSITTDDGKDTQLDVLILATGFKSQEFFGPAKFIGKNEQNLLEIWKNDRPRNYLSICTSVTPNLFFIGGPYGLIGTSAAIFVYECETNFVLQILQRMHKQRQSYISVKKLAEDEWMNEVDLATSKHILGNSSNCQSWLKNADGKVLVCPFNTIDFWWRTKSVDFSKFDFK